MHCTKKITSDMYWIGASDRRLSLFENVYPVPAGVSYNSYVVLDEKTVLFDTVDKSVSGQFFENLEYVLGGRALDYAVVNHMEPDHCATLGEVVRRYPDVKIVCNTKTAVMIKQYFTFDLDSRAVIVKEMDTLTTGRHTFAFVMAPMVHWPEAMVSYDTVDKVLYSADAFGTFGAINGNIFADEMDFRNECLPEARRYFTNIVGKYGTQVQALLKKASAIEISMVCPLHGPVWRKDIGWFIEKYQRWSTYTPEEEAVLIVYASVYGNTENTANIIASKLADKGVRNIKMYDVSMTHPSYIVAEAFRCSHIIIASTTYNAGIFVNMETLLHDLAAHNLQNRTVAVVENGTWAPTAGKLIRDILSKCKNMNILDAGVTLKSSLKDDQLAAIDALCGAVYDSMAKPEEIKHKAEELIEGNAMFKLSYGLFILTARNGNVDNGCIINTVMQVTDKPKRIAICVNKANYTHDIINETGEFNVSVLTRDTPFDVFKHFGFQSGRDVNKFDGYEEIRANNEIRYVPQYANAFISGKVCDKVDYETHTMFIADVTQSQELSSAPSVTYEYYFANIKPRPAARQQSAGTKYVCKICGYEYEGENLPDDFICPLCKHGAEDFEKVEAVQAPKTKKFVCRICGYEYEGDELPKDFICPLCKHGAEDFEEI